MDGRNKGLIVFGIVFGVFGVLLSLQRVGDPWTYNYTYPYQTIGILLVVAGIVFVALGLLYSPRRIPPPP